MKSFILVAIFLPVFTCPATAQGVGGQTETLYRWDGPNSDDLFGGAVSDAGDVNADGFDDIIVGAPGANPRGAAFVYSGKDGSLLYQWNGSGQNCDFGISVSGTGDVNGDGFADVIVGGSARSCGLNDLGSVFVYSGADGSLIYQWDETPPRRGFGHSVSGAGDVNQDGIPDCIVGSFYSDSVKVFSGADGSILFTLDTDSTDVSDIGDINGDGFADILVGNGTADLGGFHQQGTVLLYSGRDQSLLYRWDGSALYGNFGYSVSGAGDVNGDGIMDILVGEPNVTRLGDGAANVFSGADGSLLYRWEGTHQSQFGESVSDAGDINGDGFDDILIGAYWDSQSGTSNQGSAFLYSGIDGVLLHRWDGAQWSNFGHSVSTAGDVDGNGSPDLIIGQPNRTGFTGIGSAIVLSFSPNLQTNTNHISASAGGPLDLEINFSDSAALYRYKVLISAAPRGKMFRGVGIPLREDFMVHKSYFGFYPFATHSNLHGRLDWSGGATASIQLAPYELHPSWVGRTFHIAVVASYDSFAPAFFSSIAVPVFITP